MSTSGSVQDIAAVVTRLSKELELMGLPGLASQQDEHDGAIVDVIGLINASYDLIGLIRDLQRSKRQREDHAQQLLHDLQRSQWLLDKEKELTVQREREAAEACEKERQANVRLQLAETLLKKKTEENRQLVHECQLKENQWVHAIRRRDQDNHRLHQQLLKFLRTKPITNATSGSGKTGFVPLEMEIRGSLAPPRIVGVVSRSETPTRRKQWDKTVDDSRKLVEVKWKSALNSLEKDHQLLRVDYLQLVDMVGRFLTNCSAKMSIRRTTTTPNPLNSNITEWIQLPVNSMRDRLEDVFRLVEDSLQPAAMMSISGHSLDACAGDDGGRTRNENVKQSEPTTSTVDATRENCYASSYRGATVDDWLNPIMKDDAVDVTPPSYRAQVPRSSQQTSGTGKSILRLEPTTHEQQQSADRLLPLLTDPCAFPNATEGNEPLEAVANQIDWNRATKMDNSDSVYVRQNTVIVRKPTNVRNGASASAPTRIESETNDEEEDEIPSDVQQQMFALDTPCPSRRGSSSSSSSSSSSWKSQQSSGNSREIDERFFRACTDAASIVNPRRPSASSTTVSLNGGGSITAKVSFVQHTRD